MKQWVTKSCQADLRKIADRYRISEVFAEILVKRGLHSWEEMDAYLFEDMADEPDLERMLGLKEAAELLFDRMESGCPIRIIGDYDVDGVMSTYILYTGILQMGGNPSYQIPHRELDGYGIRPYMAEKAAQEGIDTIITCDNGISAVDAVRRAKELGLTVILTDHHEVPVLDGVEQIPPADVVVDPKQARCRYGYRELCGAGIAYRLMQYMFAKRGRAREVKELLPFAAIATVCDVVSLLGENRQLVKEGLRLLPKTHNPGLQALIRQMDFAADIRAVDIGFRIGPCINAAGRLGNAAQALELFLSPDARTASERAQDLYQLNETRKDITMQAAQDAASQVQQEGVPRVLIVYSPQCHESVAGIVAGRLREKFYRPVYLITDSGDHLKGSGRSIPGYHMQKELSACQEHLIEFGGHAMAAGFSLQKEELPAFRKALLAHCSLVEQDLTEKLYYDREVSLAQVNRELIQQLAWLEPTGEANPGAVFVKREAEIVSVRMCGRENQIAQIQLREDGHIYRAVDFHAEDCLGSAVGEKYGVSQWERMKAGKPGSWRIHLMFSAEIDSKYGSLQLRLMDCR